MAHFAQIDENNVVTQIIVVANEHEANGEQFCHNLLGGTWKQTSYNGNIRKRFASIGGTYDPAKDIFIAPQPFPSWQLDSDSNWVAPKPMPEGGLYIWDEPTLTWKLLA